MGKLNEYTLVWKCRNCDEMFQTGLEINKGNLFKDLDYIHQMIADGGMYKMHTCYPKDDKLFGEGELIKIRIEEP